MKGTERLERRLSLAAVVAATTLITIPSGASAATTVGEIFAPTGNCSPQVTFLQSSGPGSRYTVPAPGVLTSWSFQASAAPPQLKFKVGRPAGPDTFTIVGESALVAPLINSLTSFPIQIPVQPGDVIGFYTATAGECQRGVVGAPYQFRSIQEDLAPGETRTFQPGLAQLAVSANLETTTCKGLPPTIGGTAGRDTLTGTPNADVMVGLAGRDTLKGLDGKDVICGGPGKDLLNGGKAKDNLLGQGGADTLKGGGGKDTCKGGGGADEEKSC